MTGEDDPERAALSLLKAGARLVVITLGADGAILRGELRADVAAVEPARVLSTIGAGRRVHGGAAGAARRVRVLSAAGAVGLRERAAAAARALRAVGSR